MNHMDLAGAGKNKMITVKKNLVLFYVYISYGRVEVMGEGERLLEETQIELSVSQRQ